MTTTWILVANRAEARLFTSENHRHSAQLLRTIDHPEGRLANREIGTDRPGRAFDSQGQGRHAMGVEHDEGEQITLRFAKQLATLLDEGRTQQQFTQLILVVAPRLLGHLRQALSSETGALVIGSLDKDLPGIDANTLVNHLQALG